MMRRYMLEQHYGKQLTTIPHLANYLLLVKIMLSDKMHFNLCFRKYQNKRFSVTASGTIGLKQKTLSAKKSNKHSSTYY